jgi:putative transposase
VLDPHHVPALAIAGENRERRRQRTHPARKKPELIATAPNQV